MALSGIRVQLLIGPTVPRPAPRAVVDSLVRIEVTNNDRERDGFQLQFSAGRDSTLDYGLVRQGYLNPPARVVIVVLIGTVPEVLIDGIVTRQDFSPSNRPGEGTLHVTGEDISVQLDRHERREPFPQQSDSAIVTRLLGGSDYVACGFVPRVTSTRETPTASQRLPNEHSTDLNYIRELASRNGFVFYVEPLAPGRSLAYWGPENRLERPQPALTMNQGAATNVDAPLAFSWDALRPVAPEGNVYDRDSKDAVAITPPTSTRTRLAQRTVEPWRSVLLNEVAGLTSAEARLQSAATSTDTSDAITVTGEVDAVRYGRVLRSRRLVDVRGVGRTYGGTYYVKQVTHRLARGEYRQSFSLSREGLGALSPFVIP